MTMIDGFSGTVTDETSADYETARATYGAPGRTPALILLPSGTDDVVAAVRYAAAQGLTVCVRSGGHSPYSSADDAVVLDLSDLDGIEVLDGALVRVGSGARWGEVASILQQHGLALTSGDTSSVGVGGLTLGGGVGWLVRQQGLTIDNLVDAEIVLADGRVVTASEDSEPDLFWALRGGGGNFGVVTTFTFRARHLDGVLSGQVFFEPDHLEAALTGWRDVMRTAPEALNTTFLALPSFGPDMPPSIMVGVCYGSTDEAAARAAVQPLLDLPTVVGSELKMTGYADVLDEAHPPEGPITVVDHNGWANQLSDELIAGLVAATGRMGSSVLMIRWLTGAFNRVPADATAVAYRGAEVLIVSAAFLGPDGRPEAERTVRAAWASLSPHVAGRYGNLTQTTDDIVNLMYPGGTLERLRALKRRYDPENVFAMNRNILPE